MLIFLINEAGFGSYTGVVSVLVLIIIIVLSYKIHDAALKFQGKEIHGVVVFFILFAILFGSLNEWFFYGGTALSIYLAVVLGSRFSTALGWVIGIIGVVSVVFAGVYLDIEMPSSDCYTDWDGRGNPVVCD